jgi:hypothetical protein
MPAAATRWGHCAICFRPQSSPRALARCTGWHSRDEKMLSLHTDRPGGGHRRYLVTLRPSHRGTRRIGCLSRSGSTGRCHFPGTTLHPPPEAQLNRPSAAARSRQRPRAPCDGNLKSFLTNSSKAASRLTSSRPMSTSTACPMTSRGPSSSIMLSTSDGIKIPASTVRVLVRGTGAGADHQSTTESLHLLRGNVRYQCWANAAPWRVLVQREQVQDQDRGHGHVYA